MTTDIKKNPKIRQDIDVSENSLLMSDPDILATLLKDRTTGRNIFCDILKPNI